MRDRVRREREPGDDACSALPALSILCYIVRSRRP